MFTDLRSLWCNNFFLKEDFQKHGKVPQNDSLKALNFYYPHQGSICLQSSLLYIKPLWSSRWGKNRAYLHSIYCKVKERIHGETNHAISIKRCKCINGWMDRGMAYSLRHWFSLLYHPFLVFFLDMVTPLSFSIFFGSCFFGMPSFLFLGQP